MGISFIGTPHFGPNIDDMEAVELLVRVFSVFRETTGNWDLRRQLNMEVPWLQQQQTDYGAVSVDNFHAIYFFEALPTLTVEGKSVMVYSFTLRS